MCQSVSEAHRADFTDKLDALKNEVFQDSRFVFFTFTLIQNIICSEM